MSNLIQYAESELKRAGLYDADTDYGGGAIAGCVLDVVKVFSEQGHSGGSAAMTLGIIEKLLRYEPLSPLTSDPAEWNDVSEMNGGIPMWQSNRCPSCFSIDGGKTWYDINGKYGPKHINSFRAG